MDRVDVRLSSKISVAKTDPNGSYMPGLFPKIGGGWDLLPISWVNFLRPISEALSALADSTGNYVFYRYTDKSADFTQAIESGQKINAIDIRLISGSPVVSVGITPGGGELIELSTIELQEDGSDFNQVVNKSYGEAVTLYFTITGGHIMISISTQKKTF